MKILQSSRETHTPYVFQLDIGLDTTRFPAHDVACSTKVIVTADVSTLTDTLSHSTAVTSQSRGIQTAADRKSVDDVIPIRREINWLFIPPTGDVIDQVQTGSEIKLDPVRQEFESGVIHQVDNVAEAPSDRDYDTLSSRSVTAAAAATTGNDTCIGVQHRTVGTSEYLTISTNSALRSFVDQATNTTAVADVACNTATGRNETTTHVDVRRRTVMIDRQSVATDTEAIPSILRRASSMPPSSPQQLQLQLTRPNRTTGTSFDTRNAELQRVVTGTPTNIPANQTPATYQSTPFDVAPKRVDYNRDNGHVVSRKQVPVISHQLCTSCRAAIDEQNSVNTKASDINSLLNHRDSPDNERVNGTEHWIGEDRGDGLQGFTANGKSDVVQELRTVTYQDRAVGNDSAFPVVDCGVGCGTVWTETRGTGDRTVWTADVETCTPTVAVVDRAIGTRHVRLVHKNEATDSQQTANVGTSPAEDITSAYRGLLAAIQARPVTVSRGTATPPAPVTTDRETATEHRQLVDCGTSPPVDVTAAYRGVLCARLAVSHRVTVSRGTQTAASPTTSIDKDTTTDCVMVDRACSPIKVYYRLCFHRCLSTMPFDITNKTSGV